MKRLLVPLLLPLSAVALAQSWSQTPPGYPYNYLQTVDEYITEWQAFYNSSTENPLTVDEFSETVYAPAEVWGDATTSPPWTPKLTPRTGEHATEGHSVSWAKTEISPLKARDALGVWSTEDGAQTWAQNGGGQVASRTRTWYSYVRSEWSAEYNPF
jgi:hypothetical protein